MMGRADEIESGAEEHWAGPGDRSESLSSFTSINTLFEAELERADGPGRG